MFESVPKDPGGHDKYAPRWVITEAITLWIEETKKAIAKIPKNALKLVFFTDGPFYGPEEVEHLLKILLLDAAWQIALQMAQKRGGVPELDPSRHLSSGSMRLERFAGQAPRPCYFSDTFPQDIAGSLDPHSFVRFEELDHKEIIRWVGRNDLSDWANGRTCNSEQIIRDNRDCESAEDWGNRWWGLARSGRSHNIISVIAGWLYVLLKYDSRCC